MNIEALNSVLGTSGTQLTDSPKEIESPFKSFFDAAMNNLQETNTMIEDADQMSIDFALGKVDNVADVMIAQEKASAALQYTIQLRNKLLDAYNEIMRLQV